VTERAAALSVQNCAIRIERNANFETRVAALPKLQLAAVGSHDASCDGQTEADATLGAPRRAQLSKRLERCRLLALGNATAMIAYDELHAARVRPRDLDLYRGSAMLNRIANQIIGQALERDTITVNYDVA
jgi:hypothetical protein